MLGLVGSLLGSVASGVFGMFGQNSANQQNKDLLMEQERYNTQMSNSAYQRSSEDMQKAGLNPMSMFGSGGPAMTPGLSMPTMQNSMGAMSNSIGSAISSATQNAVAMKTIDKMSTDMANTIADTKYRQAQTDNTVAALGGIKSTSDYTKKINDPIVTMPDTVSVPLIRGGFGGKMGKDIGPLSWGSDAGAAFAAGAPALFDSVSPNSASSLSSAFGSKWPALRGALGNWWSSNHPDQTQGENGNRGYSVQFKQ